ncbi:cadherin-like beta sandwich domain-containing protein [Neobacillus muris]|uniref:cadherin-like beta sandwich domain-containing protein n=1 Tax=Neobacillus muris TaxID=2941334 RepID=UPI00203BBEFB|nr:cadherin-like beta sandwich domain-containing protein [Neobacillus muris]
MFAKMEKKGAAFLFAVMLIGMGPLSSIPTVHAESAAESEEGQTANTLSTLKIEGIELDQPFSPSETQYSAAVESQVSSISLLVESTSPNASITINGSPVISGTNSDYQLKTGKNLFTITVSDSSHPTVTYQLTVTREKSSNNLLQNISLSTGELSPSFSAEITNYTAQVANENSTITIKPKAVEASATVEINGKTVQEAGVSVNLPVGTTPISIVVTAENGEQKAYTISVTRASGSTSKPSAGLSAERNSSMPAASALLRSGTQSNGAEASGADKTSIETEKASYAKLSGLSVSEGTWDSEFSPDEYTYHISVSSDLNTVTINPLAAYSSSSIQIEGGTSQTVQLNENKKTIISIVVNYSDDDRKTYVLVFDKN